MVLAQTPLTAFQSPKSGKFISNQKTIPAGFLIADGRFQSPRSGEFVSNCRMTKRLERGAKVFQSPRSGKFVSDTEETTGEKHWSHWDESFQSPRSGKFVSDGIFF